ncbi:MAG: DsbE family thiol:disulfide interchange protein [Gammaproteobacteria bacterium]|nr:MAG: DsbE family thiol:disulfide interchange protein [Gammaproteobacteria bacterium]
MSRLKLFIPLLVFIVLAIFLLNGLERDPNAMPSALIDRPVPAFSLPVLGDEQRVESEALFQGRPALLNVWATWCISCRVEHPYLNKLSKQGVRIVGLNYKDDSAEAMKWLDEKGDPYELSVVDARGRLGLDLGVFGAPETYVVDASGTIRYKHVGVVDDRVWQQKILPIWQQLQ